MSTKLTEFQQKSKAGHPMEGIKNDSKLRLEIKLECLELTWNCPAIHQPDYGKVTITYTPAKLVCETKSLKFYLQTYRYRNAFNEELSVRICLDFIYYIKPTKVEVLLAQNNRGGIENTCKVFWDSTNPDDQSIYTNMNYKPKIGFTGGWPMVK